MPGLTAPPPLPPLKTFGRRPSAGEFAYSSLRAAILDLAMPPGSPLSRAVLAERLGISQTPVREALMRLEAERLVEVVPSASTRVALIDLGSAREAQFLRRSVELEMVRRLAMERPAELPATLEARLSEQRGLLERGEHAGFLAADDAFHAALYDAAGIAGLWQVVESRSGHLARLRRLHLPVPGKAHSILADHEALAAAILAGDGPGAEALLRGHFADTFARIAEIRAATPHYFAPD